MGAKVLTIDGPSGAGKSSLSAIVARSLDWRALDSGAVYRALALTAADADVDATDADALRDLTHELRVDFGLDGRVWVKGEDRSLELRSESVGADASAISKIPAVRSALLDFQRSFDDDRGLVADGRDMGTVVFPEAGLKVFLIADLGERVRRRVAQMGISDTRDLDELRESMRFRDHNDSVRAAAPMVPAEDAVVIDTTSVPLDAAAERVLALARDRGLDLRRDDLTADRGFFL